MKQPASPKKEDLFEERELTGNTRQSVCQPVRAEHTAKAPKQGSSPPLRRGGRGIRKPACYPCLHYPASQVSTIGMQQPRDNKRARLLPGATLDVLGNDLLIRCASYLDADGLAQLGRTSVRFGIPQPGQQRPLANEAAHQQFLQSATDEEKKCLPKRDDESDIGLCRSLESLRLPLHFNKLVGNGFGLQENPSRVTYTGYGGSSTAMSGHVMRGGRHFVEFTIAVDEQNRPYISLGVIRTVLLINGIDSDWGGHVNPVAVWSRYDPAVAEKLRSQRTTKWGDSNVHCCTYYCYDGRCFWTDWDNNWTNWDNDANSPVWQGREGLGGNGTIGLLLDLNEGNLSVFKNGRRLGVMKDGLNGEYCWFVTARSACTVSMSKGRAPS